MEMDAVTARRNPVTSTDTSTPAGACRNVTLPISTPSVSVIRAAAMSAAEAPGIMARKARAPIAR